MFRSYILAIFRLSEDDQNIWPNHLILYNKYKNSVQLAGSEKWITKFSEHKCSKVSKIY